MPGNTIKTLKEEDIQDYFNDEYLILIGETNIS